jgi:epoxyqueuosine reductase QueG
MNIYEKYAIDAGLGELGRSGSECSTCIAVCPFLKMAINKNK